MILLSFIAAYIGFAFLSMAMKRHFRQFWPKGNFNKNKVITFQLIGIALLLVSCLLCIKAEALGIGLVSWFGVLTFAALLQSMLLSYSPKMPTLTRIRIKE